MTETAAPSDATLVVLATADTLAADGNQDRLLHSLHPLGKAVRLLLLVSDTDGLAAACRLHDAGLTGMELLLAAGLPDPPVAIPFGRMPVGGGAGARTDAPDEQDEFALALSDVLWAPPGHRLAARAKQLGKPVVAPGTGLPSLPPAAEVTRGLDPEALVWFKCRRAWFGRLDHLLVALLGFCQPAFWGTAARAHWKHLRKGWGCGWGPAPYFAPPACAALAPDQRALADDAPLARRFAMLDRAASFGAYIHRDIGWAAHFVAAGAVLAAVLGAYSTEASGAHAAPVHTASVVEIVMLLGIAALMLAIRRCRLQDRWTACRMGAEQLRIARMCLPLMAVPAALVSEDTWPGRPAGASTAPDLTLAALAEVKRAVREHGVPRVPASVTPQQAAAWVRCIVQDQVGYHAANHHRLEHAERTLRVVSVLLFAGAVVAVALALLHERWPCLPVLEMPLLYTAALPAFAAAFHGAATRLGIVSRVALSQSAERELRVMADALTELIRRPQVGDNAWAEVRRLALDAAAAMGRENVSWHSQVRLQRDTLP
jgi:hypothetical protein